MSEQASFSVMNRVLMLQGQDGCVGCRVYGSLLSSTLPWFSDNWTVEFATRTFLRMRNLVAVRGDSGASMIGPTDYFGNLEDPCLYQYTIEIHNGLPIVYRQITTVHSSVQQEPTPTRSLLPTSVHVQWISGLNPLYQTRIHEYKSKLVNSSLFPNPGVLEMDMTCIELKQFDARHCDLSLFKARLVPNNSPFQITTAPLPSKDEYRLVSYYYERDYAARQTGPNGDGLFLEKHLFSQTITPLAETSCGFVVLARLTDAVDHNKVVMEMIAIRIPFGWTLIIHDGCIHGDTTLCGSYMMGMTSDHVTMSTADTVFLKNKQTMQNVTIRLISHEEKQEASRDVNDINHHNDVLSPLVLFKNSSTQAMHQFKQRTKGMSFILNPTTNYFWQNLLNVSSNLFITD